MSSLPHIAANGQTGIAARQKRSDIANSESPTVHPYRFDKDLLANIPHELTQSNQWVAWKYEKRGEKWTKVPYNPRTGTMAKVNDRTTWATFDAAVGALLNAWDGYTGVGFVFSHEDAFFGIDVDNFFDENGKPVSELPEEIANLMNRKIYLERSPSKKGFKMIGQTDRPLRHNGKKLDYPTNGCAVEAYDRTRFFTITGDVPPKYPTSGIVDCTELVEGIINQWFPNAKAKGGGFDTPRPTLAPLNALSDDEIVARARDGRRGQQFIALFDGTADDGYHSDSEADFALACMLAEVTREADQIYRVFMKSFRGKREKCQREEYVRRTVGNALDRTEVEKPQADPLPKIIIGGQLREMTANVTRAVVRSNDPPTLYAMSTVIVRVERDLDGRAELAALDDGKLRSEFARRADWFRIKNGQEIPAYPEPAVVQDYRALQPSDRALPPLDRIVATPVFDSQGHLVQRPGYHPTARLFYEPRKGFLMAPVPSCPTNEDIELAKSLLVDDLLVDFPFADEASKAHAVGLVLLPCCRDMISGPTPIFLSDAPAQGTGKGYLIQCTALAATGMYPEMLTPPDTEDEWRKRITSSLMKGVPVIQVDNVEGTFNPKPLSIVLTSVEHSDRLLGTNQTVTIPNLATWTLTANNATLGADMSRRTYYCRLDARVESPSERTGFKHDPLDAWIRRERGKLAWAICTLIQAWIAKGKPAWKESPEAPMLGSFQEWCRVIGGILDVAGIRGFLTNKNEMGRKVLTVEEEEFRPFLDAWYAAHPNKDVGVSELYALITDSGKPLFPTSLRGKDDHGRRTSLGRRLKKYVDRVMGGYRYENGSTGDKGGAQYILKKAGP